MSKKNTNKKAKEELQNFKYQIIIGTIIAIIGAIVGIIINMENIKTIIKFITPKEEISIISVSPMIINDIDVQAVIESDTTTAKAIDIIETYISNLDSYYNETSIEIKDEWLMTDGCVLNAFVQNETNINVPISDYKLVIDDIEQTEISSAEIVACSSNNQLYLYAINNGNAKLVDAKIQLSAYYYEISNNYPKRIEMLSKIMGAKNENCIFDIPEVEPGEIKRFATFEFNLDSYYECLESVGNINIDVYAESFLSDGTNISYDYLGTIREYENQLDIAPSVGGTTDSIDREIIIDITKETPYDIFLRNDFQIDSYNTEVLKLAIFVPKTCKITFHIELKEAGGGYVKSELMTQEILIPLYNIENNNTDIRIWIMNNDIIDYHYNDDPQLQESIKYKAYEKYFIDRY